MYLTEQHAQALEAALARHHQRPTPQRAQVFAALLENRDHPTADEVFAHVRHELPSLSLATVYNCLDTLIACGLVRAVQQERGATRYCANLHEHAHFQDRDSGSILDIPLPPAVLDQLENLLPDDLEAERVEIYFHGRRRPVKRRNTEPARAPHPPDPAP